MIELYPSVSTNALGPRARLVFVLVFVVVMTALVPRLFSGYSSSKAQLAQEMMRAYVDEALPAWRLVTARACPVRIGELDAFIGRRDAIDVWGTPLAMYCASTRSGDPTIVVRSAGEDATFGTADDLWSDR